MTTVFLSRYTVEKRKIRHPDIPIEMYMQVVNFLGNAEIVLKRGRVKLVFFFYHNNLYEGVIKSTEDGSELYLVSIYRTDPSKINSEKNRKGTEIVLCKGLK